LPLGNKKSVDIVIHKDDGVIVTVDVKGLAGRTCWPMDNFNKKDKNHFIVSIFFRKNFRLTDSSRMLDCSFVKR